MTSCSHGLLLSAALLAASATLGCGGSDPTDPDPGPGVVNLAFVPALVNLGADRSTTVAIDNRGTQAVGPIQLISGQILREGSPVVGAQLQAVPAEIPTLNPGASATVALSIILDSAPAAGSYEGSLEARLAGESIAALAIDFSVSPPAPPGSGRSLQIAGPDVARQGDVVTYSAVVRDSTGTEVSDPTLAWSVSPAAAGLITGAGGFVGYAPGTARIIASASDAADTLDMIIEARALSGSFSVIGQGSVSARFTSDLWVHDFPALGLFAYTGTWSCRNGRCGDRLHVWHLGSSNSPALVDSVRVDARVVNDVKVREDGAIAVITHELSNDAQNGITLLDLSDPAHPTVITRFTTGLESGVHNVWVAGDYVYVVVDGLGNGLRILDISDPATPRQVAGFYAGSSFLHDVYVRDGLAFLSHWDAGLVILDVGNGIAGGSPTRPVEVSRIQTAGGQVHNAWYWPTTGYVFVGEEDFGTPGLMHIVDASDLRKPREVATFRVPGATPHNFWLDEERAILYAAWYENGIRALDVSGALLGELERQGREIASVLYAQGSGCQVSSATCTWAPQLHSDRVFASDLNSGLWILRPGF
ncbi:MAG: hypothetical protein JSU87_07780 [Gemmatimonadota bacterium]|nr:MAG: hypothetical protein JSU87_07780 [Gemmatimonadota bacterium]